MFSIYPFRRKREAFAYKAGNEASDEFPPNSVMLLTMQVLKRHQNPLARSTPVKTKVSYWKLCLRLI